MTERKALSLLQKQRQKLLEKASNRDDIWVGQTLSYIKDIFGENSTEYSVCAQLKFRVLLSPYLDNNAIMQILTENEERILKYTESWIETVKEKGVYKQPQKTIVDVLKMHNFLNGASEFF